MSSAQKHSRHDDTGGFESSKRGRKKADSPLAASSAAVSISITNDQKAALKDILKVLMKDERAEPFLYPVDKKAFPEYYQIIDNPMDLSTVKKNLNSNMYNSAQDCLGDFRLIWANCIKFNADESDIALIANELSKSLEDLVAAKLGPEYSLRKRQVQSKKARDKEAITQSPELEPIVAPVKPAVEPEIVAIRKDFSKFIKEIKKLENMEPFLFPVDLNAAPGYLEFVSKPMDISTIEKQIKAGRYDNESKLLLADLKLIFDNCMSYNVPGSDLHNSAIQLKKIAAEMFKKSYVEPKESKEKEPDDISGSSLKSTVLVVSRKSIQSNLNVTQATIEREKFKIAVAKQAASAAFAALEYRKQETQQLSDSSASEKARGIYVLLGRTKKSELSPIGLKLHDCLKTIYRHEHAVKFCKPPDYVPDRLDIPTIATRLLDYQVNPPKFISDLLRVMQRIITSESNPDAKNRATIFSNYCEQVFYRIFPEIKKVEAVSESIASGQITETAEAKATAIAAPVAMPLQSLLYAMDGDCGSVLSTKSVETLKSLVNEIQNCDEILEYFKSKAVILAMEKCSTQFPPTLPFLTSDELYEVLSSGEVVTMPKFHSKDYLFPINFASKLSLRLYVVPDLAFENSSMAVDEESKSSIIIDKTVPFELQDAQFIKLEVTNLITTENFQLSLKETINSGPKFVIKNDSMGTLVESNDCPKNAWLQLINNGEAILRRLGGSLRRCRAVFNRVCCHKEIVPFLESIPISNSHYHSEIKSPMWLREIHTRLVEGTYDNEFDFAWDMRLIFTNCLSYNAKKSELYCAAQELMNLFNVLLCHWVHNIEDKSLDNPAKGVWDDWGYLKYFDAPNCKENFCRLTGTKTAANKLLFCSMCDDQYLPASVGLTEIPKNDWFCRRCVEAMEYTPPLLQAVAPASGVAPTKFVKDIPILPYSKDITYIPSLEMGDGWCQSVRQNRQGLKNVYLSPLGYELYSKAEAIEHKAFEETVNENLLAARAKEFQESLLVTAGSSKKAKKSKRHQRAVASTSTIITRRSSRIEGMNGTEEDPDEAEVEVVKPTTKASDGDANARPVEEIEEIGLLARGKLANFVVPKGKRIVFYLERPHDTPLMPIRAIEEDLPSYGDRRAITAENLPESGLFGLDHEDIHCYLETFESASGCSNYVYKEYANAMKQVVQEITLEIDKKIAADVGDKRLAEVVRSEQRYWLSQEVITSSDSDGTVTEHKAGFSTLFPNDISPFDGEIILSCWDFLEIAQPIIGTMTLSLSELIKCLIPSNSWMPTLGEVIFNELGYLLTTVLLHEMKLVTEGSNRFEYEWQSYLAARPLNILTWPTIALSLLNALTFSRHVLLPSMVNHSSARPQSFYYDLSYIIASKAHSATEGEIGDMLCIALRHPILHLLANNTSFARAAELSNVIQAMKERFIVTLFDDAVDVDLVDMPAYPSEVHVLLDLLNCVKALGNIFPANSLGKSIAQEYEQWFVGMLGRLHINLNELQHDEHGFKGFSDDSCSMNATSMDSCEASSSITIAELLDVPTGKSDVVEQFVQPYYFGWSAKSGIFSLTSHSFDLNAPCSYSDVLASPTKLGQLLKARARAHGHLQTAWLCMRSQDSDSWTKDDRFGVMACLLDQCLATQVLAKHQSQFVDKPVELDTLKPTGELPPLEHVKVTGRSNVKCYYTGLEPKQVNSQQQWVFVPDWLLRSPTPVPGYSAAMTTKEILNSSSSSSSTISSEETSSSSENAANNVRTRGTRIQSGIVPNSNRIKGREVALESAVVAVAAAREAAIREKHELELRCDESIRQLSLMELQPLPSKTIAADTLKLHTRIPRSRCLGYDRHGREYWLLGVQESAPLVPLGRTLSNTMTTADPAVLVKEKSGWWGFHNGRYLDTLLNSFINSIPCERQLRINMAERLNFTRRKLYTTTLRFRPTQHEWLANIIRGEVAIANYKTPVNSDMQKSLEVLWARCVEVRGHVHYSEIHRLDEAGPPPADQSVRAQREAQIRRHKRLRDILMNVCFDLHPTHGWMHNGFHAVSHMRGLYSSTTATRLLADPTIYRHFQEVMRRSSYRQMQMANLERSLAPPPPPVIPASLGDGEMEVDREGEDGNGSTSADGTQLHQQNQSASSSSGMFRGLRPVEQLHVLTHEVLRVHKTGRDAAKFLGVSQSGISLCLTGVKSDAFGFKWRYYVGPKIDFEAIEHKQMSLREIQDLQFYRGKKLTSDVPSSSSSNQPILMSLPPKANYPHVIVADGPLSSKLLKLKVELINILTVIPERAMRWGPEYDDDSDTDAAANGVDAAGFSDDEAEDDVTTSPGNNVEKSAADAAVSKDNSAVKSEAVEAESTTEKDSEMGTMTDNDDSAMQVDGVEEEDTAAGTTRENEDGEMEAAAEAEVEKEVAAAAAETKAEMKRLRQARRKRANESILKSIRAATTAQQLFDVVSAIQKAIPPTFLLDFDTSKLPTKGYSISATALRIYALDRALRYEDLKGIEATLVQCEKPFRPRVCFAPRCFLSSTCWRFFGHDGKCTTSGESASRFPDLLDTGSLGAGSAVGGIGAGAGGAYGGSAPASLTPAQAAELANRKRLREEAEAEERNRKLQASSGLLGGVTGLAYLDPDSIEFAVPYVPTAAEISSLVWV